MFILAYFLLCVCSFLNKRNSPIERERALSHPSFSVWVREGGPQRMQGGGEKQQLCLCLHYAKAELRRHTATDADAAFTNPTNSSPLSQ